MKNFKPLAVAALVAASAFCAHADTLDLSSGSAGFSSTPAIGGFTDIFTFTLTSPVVANASLTSVVNGTQDVDFFSITLTGPSGIFSFASLNPDPVEVWALPASGASLAAGSYTLAVIGSNFGGGGSYGGNIAVTPIPEPESYALMLAGLLIVGFLSRRRSG